MNLEAEHGVASCQGVRGWREREWANFLFTREDVEDKYISGGTTNGTLTEKNETKSTKVSVADNVRWKELGALVAVWLVILAMQIAKTYVKKCSGTYWLIELL
ncbi:hypothetical protein EV2_036410 [Malus domestica]